jgi:hypothetical protein
LRVIRPNEEQLSALQGFERIAFEITDRVNRTPPLKWIADAYLRHFVATWITAATKNLLHVHGLENAVQLAPDRGVVLASNHLSFFDMYVISCVMLRETEWIKGMYFPVRSDFFYEGPDGVFVNALMAAMTMYPPVLRDSSRRTFNSYVTEFISDQMKVPGMLCGVDCAMPLPCAPSCALRAASCAAERVDPAACDPLAVGVCVLPGFGAATRAAT